MNIDKINKNLFKNENFNKIKSLYKKNGFVIIKNFLPKSRISKVKSQIINSKKN